MKDRKRIGVLRGGPSPEYDVSLKTGAAVLSALRSPALEGRFTPRDIFIDRDGAWHMDGLSVLPENLFKHVDAAWNALHGYFGEDGKIQSILEAHGIPFTGSGSAGSAIAMNKALAKAVLTKHGIRSPYWKEVSSSAARKDPEAVANVVFKGFILPAIVKPVSAGSSLGVSMARTKEELTRAIKSASEHGDTVLVEEFIPGAEATCGVIEGFRGEELYALPPVEIRHKRDFFDFDAKYGGGSEEIVPASFHDKIKKDIEELAKKAHRFLGLRHYSRSDFIIHPRRGIYVLEVNSLPGLTEASLMPKALQAVGSSLHEFVDHILSLIEKAD